MTLPVFPCLPRLLSLLAVGSVLLASAYADAPAAGPTPTPANAPALSPPPAKDLLEQGVDSLLRASGVPESGNTAMHFVIAAVLLFAALVLRRLATRLLFGVFRRLASRTKTTFDDKLLPALESPVNALFALIGTFAALKVLKLPPGLDEAIRYSAGLAFSLVLLWLILRTLNTALQHAQSIAEERALGVAVFMPWIRKSLVAVAAIFGALVVAQSQGADVQAVLAGLGIGGLAFALAAQDTIANVFGSVVVAFDQPFRVGEAVRIGGFTGTVEEIGLRSTKVRGDDRSLLIIPNKTVAAENIVNLSRFDGRRVDQVLSLTYASRPADLEALVSELRQTIVSEPEVDPSAVHVYFRDFTASSLDIWIFYRIRDPDLRKHLALRQRLNLAFMRLVEARGLAFAFPTQSYVLEVADANRVAAAQPAPPPAPR
jgi:MscS family membrane protein